MRSTLVVTLVPAAVALLWGCSRLTDPCDSKAEYPRPHPERVTVPQGVWGLVAYWDGDFMPLCPSGTIYPAGRELRIHEETRLDQAEMEPGGFFTEVRTPEVARVWSDADGFFQGGLPPGRYSLFSVEDTVLYANGFSGDGYIYPFTVVADSTVMVTFDITWNASS
jgi:hypothetical protein